MMTNGDREGRIILSHPHMISGLFFLLVVNSPFSIGQHEKTSKNLNTLRYDMMTSF